MKCNTIPFSFPILRAWYLFINMHYFSLPDFFIFIAIPTNEEILLNIDIFFIIMLDTILHVATSFSKQHEI